MVNARHSESKNSESTHDNAIQHYCGNSTGHIRLPSGCKDSIERAACFDAGGLFCGGNFLGGIGYLGAEFDIAGDTHYGWLEISSLDGVPYIDVLSWAYESEPGVGILAGAIPEPSATAMLLAAGLLILRRRRQSHQE